MNTDELHAALDEQYAADRALLESLHLSPLLVRHSHWGVGDLRQDIHEKNQLWFGANHPMGARTQVEPCHAVLVINLTKGWAYCHPTMLREDVRSVRFSLDVDDPDVTWVCSKGAQ